MNTINVKDLMSISGKGGLFRFIAEARNGVVLESLQDKKRHVAPATARISSLEDIAIFTTEEDMPLSDVFMKIHEKEKGAACIDSKSSNEEMKNYFSEVLPDYDDERVYVSDIKKVIVWYNQLQKLGLLEVKELEEEADTENKPGTEDQKADKKQAPEDDQKQAPKEEKKDN